MISAKVEIITDFVGGRLGNKDRTVFAAFAANHEFATFEIDAVAVEVSKFGDAKARAEQELDDSSVTESSFGICTGGVEEAFYFVEMEKGHLFFDGAREIDESGVEALDFSTREVLEKAAEGDEVIGLGESGEFLMVFVFVAIEPETITAEKFFGDLGGL